MNEKSDRELREKYTELIRKKGITSSVTELRARELGVDVDGLMAARGRERAASLNHPVHLELSRIALDTEDWRQDPAFKPWESVVLPGNGKHPRIDLLGLGICGEIELESGMEHTVAALLKGGIEIIQQQLLQSPLQHRFSLPLGARDIVLDRITWISGSKSWTLYGGLDDQALERKPSKLHPSRSIDLMRRPPEIREHITARPWPVLDHVWLKVDHWPSGHRRVTNAFETREECPPERQKTHPELPDQIILRFPSDQELKWEDFGATKPATHFLKQYAHEQSGELANEVAPYGVEAIVCDYSVALSASDPRASVRSEVHGPAPLPMGTTWPVCPNCGETMWFSESLDFRDIAFSSLLPGSSLSIFICGRCLDAGEWTEGTVLIWLPREGEIQWVSNGSPATVHQARQWIDTDFPGCGELPKDIVENWPDHLPSNSTLWPSGGTKAGGVPNYLQQDPTLFDSNGCLMEYIGQFVTPESTWFDGYGYIFHSTTTGETAAELQIT